MLGRRCEKIRGPTQNAFEGHSLPDWDRDECDYEGPSSDVLFPVLDAVYWGISRFPLRAVAGALEERQPFGPPSMWALTRYLRRQ